MNRIALLSARSGSAALQARKWARRLTESARSQSSTLVPCRRAPRPIPTFSTRPSKPPSDSCALATMLAHCWALGDIGGDGHRLAAHVLDQRDGGLCRAGVQIGAGDGGSFARGQHRDRPPVAGRRIRIGARPCAGTNHEHPPIGQPQAIRRATGCLGYSSSPGRPPIPGSRSSPSELGMAMLTCALGAGAFRSGCWRCRRSSARRARRPCTADSGWGGRAAPRSAASRHGSPSRSASGGCVGC